MSKLWEVLDILRERGWCKGALVNQDGQHCLLGALGMAYGATDSEMAPFTNGPADVFRTSEGIWQDMGAIERTIAEHHPDLLTSDLVSFNNDPSITWDDMERVVEKAAIASDEVLSV